MLTKILGNNLSLPHDKSKYLVMVIQDLVVMDVRDLWA